MDRRGWVWGGAAIAALALALIGGRPARAVEDASGDRIRCRSFAYDPIASPELDTRDPATPVGKWVADEEDRGWRVVSAAPQVVVKATGKLEAWAHVCLTPRR